MYRVDFRCDKCQRDWYVWESITWKGLCPVCAEVLQIEFTTVSNKTGQNKC